MNVRQFIDFLEGLGGAQLQNQQCFLVSGTGRNFEMARDRIINQYHAVCALENVAPFVKHLRTTLHWPDLIELRQRNQSPKSGVDDDGFDEEIVNKIRKDNLEDFRLYQFARDEAPNYWRS
jgi:hypothetical protein